MVTFLSHAETRSLLHDLNAAPTQPAISLLELPRHWSCTTYPDGHVTQVTISNAEGQSVATASLRRNTISAIEINAEHQSPELRRALLLAALQLGGTHLKINASSARAWRCYTQDLRLIGPDLLVTPEALAAHGLQGAQLQARVTYDDLQPYLPNDDLFKAAASARSLQASGNFPDLRLPVLRHVIEHQSQGHVPGQVTLTGDQAQFAALCWQLNLITPRGLTDSKEVFELLSACHQLIKRQDCPAVTFLRAVLNEPMEAVRPRLLRRRNWLIRRTLLA